MLPERETDHSYPSTADVTKGWSNIIFRCLHVTHRIINLLTELFVEDRNLFYLYAIVDLTQAINLTLIRWTKLQYLRHG